MRVFLDANILFSAAKSDGAIRHLLELLLEGGHECCVDAYVIEEARRNLAAKASDRAGVLVALLDRMSVVPLARDTDLESILPLPEKDRPVLAAAIRAGCAALVTGDKTHFGATYGKTIRGVAIHSPQSLAEAAGIAPSGKSGRVGERAVPYRVKKSEPARQRSR